MKLLRYCLGTLYCIAACAIFTVPRYQEVTPSKTILIEHDMISESMLKKAVSSDMNHNGAKEGLALLLDLSSRTVVGSIVCSKPSTCSSDDAQLSTPWEPGSVMKPFVAATALNTSSISEDTQLFDQGVTYVAGRSIDNFADNFPMEYDVNGVLSMSRNTGAVQLLKSLGNGQINKKSKEAWYDYVTKRFHLSGDSDLFMVQPGTAKDSDFRFALSSFGVGVTTTPIRLVAAYSSFANDGVLCAFDGVTNCSQAISPQTAHSIKTILQSAAVSQHGMPRIDGYIVGGKSGTAPIAGNDGVYGSDSGVYVGFIESTNDTRKRYVLLVRYKEPLVTPASAAARETWRNILLELTR